MPIDERTQRRDYPLPSPHNDLQEDWPRLIAAFREIDADIAQILEALESGGPWFDAVQDLIATIGENEDLIETILRDKLSVADFNRRAGQPSEAVYTYDAAGNLIETLEIVAGLPRLTTYTYDPAGNLECAQTEYDGQARTETFFYDDAGNLAGVTATET
ncbi:MAG: hypothetical protein FWD77_01670 [Betaproteobacteria bacterium]|nr:hypothetical protein [Betaproteobacteria bacterium]